MADANSPPLETPEEVLESEIKDLERVTLNSGWLWAAAALGLVILAGAAFLITNWDNRSQNARPFSITPEAMTLTEPRGRVERDLTFRWDAVPRSASYIVVVTAVDGGEVEILRPVHDPFLRPTETEVSNLNPGEYAWTVEARSDKGQLIGYGESTFTISGSAQ